MADTRRDRYRADTRREVKEHALDQLAERGIEGLSVNAIARAMGMSGPALYRYFANRDELLAELVIDAYDDFADAMEAVADNGPRAVADAMWDWARAQPHRYLLLFGTPIPGFAAPEQSTLAARRSMTVLLKVIAETAPPAPSRGASLEREVETAPWAPEEYQREGNGPLLVQALLYWTRLHGVLSLEVNGQFATMGFTSKLLYDREVESLLSTEA